LTFEIVGPEKVLHIDVSILITPMLNPIFVFGQRTTVIYLISEGAKLVFLIYLVSEGAKLVSLITKLVAVSIDDALSKLVAS